MAEIYKLFAVSLLKSRYSFSSNQIKSELEFEEQQNKATVLLCISHGGRLMRHKNEITV